MTEENNNTSVPSKINKKELKKKIVDAVKNGEYTKAARFKEALLSKKG